MRLEELKGPAFLLYWSWDVNGNMLSFFNPVNWLRAEKRWDRVFRSVRCDEVGAPEVAASAGEAPAPLEPRPGARAASVALR